MEHRWGRRVTTGVVVRLDARPGVLTVGKLQNASLSGGYVEGVPTLPLLTCVHLELEGGYGKRLETGCVRAHVVRSDPGGLGLEWAEFAPAAIRTLIVTREHSMIRSAALSHLLPASERAARLLLSCNRDSPSLS